MNSKNATMAKVELLTFFLNIFPLYKAIVMLQYKITNHPDRTAEYRSLSAKKSMRYTFVTNRAEWITPAGT